MSNSNYSNKEVVLAAVKKNGFALRYASDSLKKDKEVVLAAVKNMAGALKYADNSFKKDKEVVLAAVKQNGYALYVADDSLKKDKEVVLAAVKQDDFAFEYADDSLKKDKEFVLAAVKQNGYALPYADDSLKKDKEVVLAAVKQNGRTLEYADNKLKKDKEVVLAAVKQNGYALRYADNSLKKADFLFEAYKLNPKIIKYLNESMRNKINKLVRNGTKNNHKYKKNVFIGEVVPNHMKGLFYQNSPMVKSLNIFGAFSTPHDPKIKNKLNKIKNIQNFVNKKSGKLRNWNSEPLTSAERKFANAMNKNYGTKNNHKYKKNVFIGEVIPNHMKGLYYQNSPIMKSLNKYGAFNTLHHDPKIKNKLNKIKKIQNFVNRKSGKPRNWNSKPLTSAEKSVFSNAMHKNYGINGPNAINGGSQFIHVPNYGKRKVRYQKNGRAYVIVKGNKIKL